MDVYHYTRLDVDIVYIEFYDEFVLQQFVSNLLKFSSYVHSSDSEFSKVYNILALLVSSCLCNFWELIG